MADKFHWSFNTERFKTLVLPGGFEKTLAELQDYEFDPEASYQNDYDIVFLHDYGSKRFNKRKYSHYGQLSTKCQRDDDTSRFNVTQKIKTAQAPEDHPKEKQVTEVEFVGNNDRLCTLSENSPWLIKSRIENLLDTVVEPYSQYEEWGRCYHSQDKLVIEKKIKADQPYFIDKKIKKTLPLTTNWSLLDAIQRKEVKNPKIEDTICFNMYDNLEKVHYKQKLGYLGSLQPELNGRKLTLQGYYHTGQGIMPRYYWVNDQGLLLIVRFSLMAYIFRGGGNI